MAYNSKSSQEKVFIKKVFQFRSDLKRMSTVCEIQGFEGIENGFYLLVKGAPEVIGEHFAEVINF